MTAERFAEVLSQLVADAEDVGLPSHDIVAELVAMAKTMRLCQVE